jgi:hypothetical protein
MMKVKMKLTSKTSKTSNDQIIRFFEQKDKFRLSSFEHQGFSMRTITLEERVRYAQVRLDEKLF